MTTKQVAAIRAALLRPGQCRVVSVDGHELSVFNVDGRYYTLSNACPHIGGPLGEGVIVGQSVTCPWHGWKFDVITGRCAAGDTHVESFPTSVDGAWVMVELPVETAV